VRLGVYADLRFRDQDGALSTDRSFVNFLTSLPPRVDEVVLFGRLDPSPGRDANVIPDAGISFVPLPYYRSVFAPVDVARALPGSCRAFAAHLDRLDAVWVFGPAPVANALAIVARRRRLPLFLGVRQDYVRYVGNRLPGRAWLWALVFARALEASFRAIARETPTVTVGGELARCYAAGSAPVLPIGLSLVRAVDVVPREHALGKRWNGTELRLLSVGRLDPEKNPMLLLDVISGLHALDPRWRLSIAGDGLLTDSLRDEIARRRLEDVVELLGDVAPGPDLWKHYRSSHAFLHVSLTEGLPQVIFEAEAAGLPIVATDVGGVAEALGRDERGLLVRPRDAEAAIVAVNRLGHDEVLRRRLITAGLEHAARETMDAQQDRLIEFFLANLHRDAARQHQAGS
jgi:glycosyltransferase involved in cell wall biosynthesis